MKTETKGETHRVAYSYARFSSAPQALGDSERRQIEDARKYAAENGFDLDESIGVDRGLSGYTGENLAVGVLGSFIRRVKAGEIPKNAILIIENPDRLSRQKFAECYEAIYAPILKAGIELHFLRPRAVLKPGHGFVEIIQVGVEIDRAGSESEAKSKRVGDAWESKRRAAKAGVVVTGSLPGWVTGRAPAPKRNDPGEPMKLNKERAQIVRRIFEMAASGMGQKLIARKLNEEGVPPFRGESKYSKGNRWPYSYIAKLLSDRRVIGEFQLRKAGQPEGEVIDDYFPQIVSPVLWQRVQDSLASRRNSVTKRPAFAGRNSAGGSIENLFSGKVYSLTGGKRQPLYYETTQKNGRRAQLIELKTSEAAPHWIDYALFETGFLQFLDQLDWKSVLGATESSELQRAREAVASAALAIERSQQTVEKITDLLLDTPSPALKNRLLKTEQELEAHRANKEKAEQALAELERRNADMLDTGVAYSKLAESSNLEARSRLRQEIRRKVAAIELDFRDKPSVTEVLDKLESKHGKLTGRLGEYRDWAKKLREVACTVRFVNGTEKHLLFEIGLPGGVYRMAVVEPGKRYHATLLEPQRKSAKRKA
jgi:DNA invertase Pin-like site-specific DNA recombinase